MSVNLTKNNDSLVAAWKSVVDDKSSTNWAVFGYEGGSNNLKVVGTGDRGLQQMIDELNSGEIQYAFCRVIDTKTSLPKCLLINWQGEGAPIVRKGTCANHIRDIERLLKGAHITLNARSEDDVEIDFIMEQLAKATGSTYKFREPRGKDVGNSGPVGTTYKRVIPEQEINATERDEFWQKEEMEEKARVAEEKRRLDKERQQLELETRSREEQQSKLREQAAAKLPISQRTQIKSEQRTQEIKNLRNQQLATAVQQNGSDSDEEHKSRSEELRRLRSTETQQLIAQRTINARAVFEQNSAAGQMKAAFGHQSTPNSKSVVKEPVKIVKKVVDAPKEKEVELVSTPPAPAPVPAQTPAPVPSEPALPKVEAVKEVLNVEPSPLETKDILNHVHQQQQQQQQQLHEDTHAYIMKEVELESNQPLEAIEAELFNQLNAESESYLFFDPNNEGMKARALYDYQAADDTEITFDPGDIITHIDAIDEGWWQGLGPDGTYGLFPANYVEVIDYANT
ncbi:GSCOCG00005883001-RA-CDS [Cotesia congregata]|uniref:Similar to dbnl-a: Drebrin-like protein A (Xenopus laevis) n=1 Tax=Cotesia congregata TaxID=51543 RepID=A0A8J2MZ49_COTCN|nr:GSCOCG00005883001-RA-CDS [Cotesia congregata]CAG5106637.1 Similar to dbnl-a: Drebrin-like protein A (Xenopus laevis) [Cotesia congregata]